MKFMKTHPWLFAVSMALVAFSSFLLTSHILAGDWVWVVISSLLTGYLIYSLVCELLGKSYFTVLGRTESYIQQDERRERNLQEYIKLRDEIESRHR